MTGPSGSAAPRSGGRARARTIGLVCLPIVVFLGLTLRTLEYGLVWNDELNIGEKQLILAQGPLSQAFLRPEQVDPGYRIEGYRSTYYRPLLILLLSAVDRAGSGETWQFRAAALAVGVLSLLAFLACSKLLLRRLEPAVLATALVAAHPAGLESYVWLSGLSEGICDLFVVTSVALGLLCAAAPGTRARVGLGLLSWLALVAGLLSKEKAAILPVLLLAALVSARFGKDPLVGTSGPVGATSRRGFAGAAAALLAAQASTVAAYFLAARPALLGSALGLPAPIGGSTKVQLLSALASWPESLLWILAPLHSTTSDVVRVVTSGFDPAVWLGGALAAGSFVAWILLLRTGRPVAALGLAWIWIAFLPNSNLIPQLHARGERYLFLSVFGAALLVADLGFALLARIPHRRRAWARAVVAIVLVGLLAQRTWTRTPDWQSTLTLFEADVARDPAYREGRHNLAKALFDRGRYAEASRHIEPLLRTGPEASRTVGFVNLIGVYQLACVNRLALGQFEGVVELSSELARSNPGIARVAPLRICLGQAQEQRGRIEEALGIYLEVLPEFTSEPPPALLLLIARAYARLGRAAVAHVWLDRASRASAGDPQLGTEIRRVRAFLRELAGPRDPAATPPSEP